jgi:hypothetical protein
MLTVVTPASSTRLTTVAAVRAETGVTAEQLDDSGVEALIDVASGLVAEYCNRVFARETVRETFLGPVASPIILMRVPVVAVDGVRVAGADLAATDFRLDGGAGMVFRLSGHSVIGWRPGAIEITYTAGFVLPGESGRNLPMMVERATVLIASAIYSARQRDVLVKSESVDGVSRTDYWMPGQGSALPHPEAEGLLKPFVMPRLF